MKNSPKVTVIMAVYNAEPYMRRCLNSLQAQTLKDFDVILVDDGSTDNSLAIAKEYAREDSRFRIYHKENGGVSSARQYGIDRLAEKGGKYSIHVDPDDWVEPQMLERLYKKAEETGADMVICDYWKDGIAGSRLHRQDPKSENPLHVRDALFQGLHGSLWNKLTRSACYKEAGIKFPQGMNFCEDLYVNICLLQRSVKKVVYLPEAFYHYDNISNPRAETRKKDSKHIDFTRTEIVRSCREVVSHSERSKPFCLFEARMAFSIIKNGSLPDKEFRVFFEGIPFSLLFHHSKNMNTGHLLLTCLAIHTNLGKARASKIFCKYLKVRHFVGVVTGLSKSK